MERFGAFADLVAEYETVRTFFGQIESPERRPRSHWGYE